MPSCNDGVVYFILMDWPSITPNIWSLVMNARISTRATLVKKVKLSESLCFLYLKVSCNDAFRVKELVLSYRKKVGDTLYLRVVSQN